MQSIVHGHLQVYGDCVHPHKLKRWPCGAENEGLDIITISPKDNVSKLWVVNVEGHGFVALIGDEDPEVALCKLGELSFEAK